VGRPLIVSTGMAHLSEVEAAVRTIREAGNQEFTLLHCVSNYPADPGDVNLKAMGTMAAAFGVPVGYSDHTLGLAIPVAAVAMGASVIEKHLTLDQNLPGPDHRASLEPDEFMEMVQSIRRVEAAKGHGRKEPAESEANTASVARKFLVASQDIPAGSTLTEEMIALKRAGSGLEPGMLPHLIGRATKEAIPANGIILLEFLA
jgi:N,N'-diacetyllegionaminate synthase